MPTSSPRSIILKDLLKVPENLAALSWEQFRPGVKIHRLYGNQSDGPSAALLWYEPGAGIPRHEHQGWEHLLILSNFQTDDRGRNEAGTLIINPPGSSHAVQNDKGGVVLAIWEKPVRFL